MGGGATVVCAGVVVPVHGCFNVDKNRYLASERDTLRYVQPRFAIRNINLYDNLLTKVLQRDYIVISGNHHL